MNNLFHFKDLVDASSWSDLMLSRRSCSSVQRHSTCWDLLLTPPRLPLWFHKAILDTGTQQHCSAGWKIKCDSAQWMQLPYLLYLQQWHSTLWNDEWTRSPASFRPLQTHYPPSLLPGARREPHSSPAQPVGGPGSVHGGGPGRISGRATPHHAGGRPAQAAQQWQLLRRRAAIQAGTTDGPSQHGEEGKRGWRDEWRQGGGEMKGRKGSIMNGHRDAGRISHFLLLMGKKVREKTNNRLIWLLSDAAFPSVPH